MKTLTLANKIFLWACLSALAFSKPVVVNTITLKTGSLQQEENFVGNVVFKEVANIASQSRGVVEEVYFHLGQRVKKGEKLIALNEEFLQKDILIKQAKLDQARYILEKKKKELERYKNLLETQSIPLQQYENIEYEVKSQEANILALQAELDISILDLGYKTIYAPFDGVIVVQKAHKGEWVNTGEVVFQILNTKSIEVVADVPSFMINHLAIDQKVKVRINNRNYSGSIVALIPKADIGSRNFPAHIRIASDDMLLEGMSASITLSVGKQNTGFLIPRDSIVQYRGRSSVFVVREGKAVGVPVELLSVNRSQALIKGAMNAGEKLVSRGQDRLEDGSEVKVIQ